jgi:membrane protease YdiL (CAAX protease family)
MSSTPPPKPPSSSRSEWLLWALLPWPAVSAGLYYFHSALLAFAFYAMVCLLGAWRLNVRTSLRPKLGWRVHLGIALGANILLVGAYALLGQYVMPVEKMRSALGSVGVTRTSFWWLFPYFLIGNPFVEERLWRGGIALKSYGGFPFGSLVSGVFFGAWHSLAVFLFMPAWSATLATLGVIAVGIALAEVASTTKSLGDTLLFHALAADLPLLIILALWL